MPRNAPRDSLYLAAFALVALALVGCTPAIGDRCTLSTDCSVQGSRICDTTQTNGYCTIVPCTADSCPDKATCVDIGASVPGCPYDDYAAPSRVSSAMCLKTCNSNSDCRQSDGYSCASPAGPTSSNVVLDIDKSKKVCLIAPSPASSVDAQEVVDAQVCSSSRIDASPLEASVSTSAAAEGGADGGVAEAASFADAPVDATLDAPVDATLDAPMDAILDAPVDATADSTVADGDSE